MLIIGLENTDVNKKLLPKPSLNLLLINDKDYHLFYPRFVDYKRQE